MPILPRAQGAVFDNLNLIPNVTFIVGVMSHEFLSAADIFFKNRMFDQCLDTDDYSLVVLIAHYEANKSSLV